MAATHLEVGSSARPRVVFYLDGAPSNLDSGVPTVTITRPDSTTIASGTVSPVAGETGTYDFVLAAQANPTVLTITWAGQIGGLTQTLTTQVEVVGVFLYPLAEMRAMRRTVVGDTPFADSAAWPAATLAAVRARVTEDFAYRVGWSFVPRFAREVRDGDGSCKLVLDHIKARNPALSVTVNGVAQPVGNYTVKRSGIIEATSNYVASGTFTQGRSNVVVEYVHGFDVPPPEVSGAAMARTAMLLMPSQGSTVNQWTTPDGTTYSYSQAGQRIQGGGKRYYGVPDIDSTLSDYAPASYAVA